MSTRPWLAPPYDKIKLLDHGYLKLIDFMGEDSTIIEAARQSTGKGFLGWGVEETCAKCGGSGTNEPENGPGSLCRVCVGRRVAINKPGDEKLLAYLYENRHDTPFEIGEIVFDIQAPIFVFREWHRHRTQSYNELSARYTPLPDVNYLPTKERLLIVNAKNKQASKATGAVDLTHEAALKWLKGLELAYGAVEEVYQQGLAAGVPKECARIILPVGRYSRMWAKTDLRNWLAFLTLRSDDAAQWEIRQYAYAVGHFISKLFPRTWDLFLNHDRRKPVIDKQGFLRVAT